MNLKDDMLFIKNNKVIEYDSKEDYLNREEIKITECDFVVYSDFSTNPVNIKIINDVTLLDKKETYYCQPSDIKFFLVEIILNDKHYKIDLTSETYNFYVVDNILDKKFFLYYLDNYYPNFNIDGNLLDTCELSIKIIDHHVNTKTIDINTQSICIHTSNYVIQ